jgi:hypothetical protein
MPRTSSVPDQPHTDMGVQVWSINIEQIKFRSGKQLVVMTVETDHAIGTRQWDVTPGKGLANIIEDILVRTRTLLVDRVWEPLTPPGD